MSDFANQPIRDARRERKYGKDAHCSNCGFPDTAALQGKPDAPHCYECDHAERDLETVEDHHLPGKEVMPDTVGVPGNLHRVLSDAQLDWPDEVRHNTQRDPLLWLAGIIYAVRDGAAFVLKYAHQIGDWIVLYVQKKRAEHGDRWWEAEGMPNLWAVGGAPA